MDKHDEFLREVTLRICSSLEIQTALGSTFNYLREFFPIGECYFHKLDTDACAVQNLAYISTGPRKPSQARLSIPLSRELWKWCYYRQGPYLVDQRSPDASVRALATAVGLEGRQDLVLPLREKNRLIGALVLRSRADEKFDETHLDLIRVIVKPISIAMSNALAHESLVRYRDLLLDDNRFLKDELQKESPQELIGADGGLKNIMDMVRLVAPLDNIVLLLGETGVGKEVIANSIHYSSPRSKGPFVKVNCGAIPESLIDSELFGHEKGAFTGASSRKRGRFERAHNGTLFLDEIGELPLAAQVRLLRVLQHHVIERVGSTEPVPIDVRIIAATHQKLDLMISENRFREDLWYRLNVFPVVIPPLRQRTVDIPKLTDYFIERKCRAIGIAPKSVLASGAMERLLAYDWPGNVRELENVIEREIILHRAGPLPFTEFLPADRKISTTTAVSVIPSRMQRLDEVMATHIQNVLRTTGGRILGPGGAAEILGLPGSTLRARMRKLNIKSERKIRRTKV